MITLGFYIAVVLLLGYIGDKLFNILKILKTIQSKEK